jgi:hypothetical protein
MRQTDLTVFATLFAGRTDAYFVSAPRPRAKRSPVTVRLFADHLTGVVDIGTYPVRDDATCRWGCIDIDTPQDGTDDDSYRRATDIWSVWRYYGLPAWVERSRSKGYHVWIFCDWLPARVVRSAGLWVNHIAEAESREVNPKNVAPWLTGDGLINTVRTPYAGAANPGRMVMLDEQGQDIEVDEWVRAAGAQLCRTDLLRALADRWDRNAKQDRRTAALVSAGQDSGTSLRLGTGSSQEAVQILRGLRRAGPGERDNQFWTMACYLRRRGEPLGLALRMVETAWREQVSDQAGFPLDQALEKVHRAYR